MLGRRGGCDSVARVSGSRGGCRFAANPGLVADNRNAHVSVHPESAASVSNQRVPREEFLKSDAVLCSDTLAAGILGHEVESIAVAYHTWLDRLRRCCRGRFVGGLDAV